MRLPGVAVAAGFVPPPYPYDRLEPLKAIAAAHPDGKGAIDLSIGTPCDPPPPAVVAALASSNAERGYPTSIGSPALRTRRQDGCIAGSDVDIDPVAIAACVGTKEFVATTPQWLRLRSPDKDTVLYPAISYPTYAMGATLAGCRAVPYARARGRRDADAERSLCLWVNSPANPTGELTDLAAAAGVGPGATASRCSPTSATSSSPGTVRRRRSWRRASTASSLCIRCRSGPTSPAAGPASTPATRTSCKYLAEVRKHVGLMMPGPVQAAAVEALNDDDHVNLQRDVYEKRLMGMAAALDTAMPKGAFYLWMYATEGDGWDLADHLARHAGCIVSPGEFYGPAGQDHVRHRCRPTG